MGEDETKVAEERIRSISLADQIASVKREIAMRKKVYPKWVQSGRMKQAEAHREIDRMTAALHTLIRLQGSAVI